VLVPDGRVLFVPLNSDAIGLFDAEELTFETVPLERSGGGGFSGGVR